MRELRSDGLSESTGAIVIGVLNRIYRLAAPRLGWGGTNPRFGDAQLSERPKPAQTKRRRIFEGAELEQAIAAAREPWEHALHRRGPDGCARVELLALPWCDVSLDDLGEAQPDFAWQVDRQGKR